MTDADQRAPHADAPGLSSKQGPSNQGPSNEGPSNEGPSNQGPPNESPSGSELESDAAAGRAVGRLAAWGDRVFDTLGADGAAPADRKLLAFRRFLLLTTSVELWEMVRIGSQGNPVGAVLPTAIVVSACAVAAWTPIARTATLVAALTVLAHRFSAFPDIANHHYAQLLMLLFMALYDPKKEEERKMAIGALAWLFLIAFFFAGVQKLLWGYYFGGEFLSMAIAAREPFALLFGWVVPQDEVERIVGMQLEAGSGPYRIDSPAFLAMSHVAYLGELLLPPLFFSRRLRGFAIAASIVYFVAIESGAMELIFGGIMVHVCLLLTRRDWNTPLLYALMPLQLYFLLTALEWVPRGFEWH